MSINSIGGMNSFFIETLYGGDNYFLFSKGNLTNPQMQYLSHKRLLVTAKVILSPFQIFRLGLLFACF